MSAKAICCINEPYYKRTPYVHGPIGAPDLGFSVDIEKKRYIHTPLGPLLTLIYIARGKGEERKVSVSSPSQSAA